MNLLGLGLFDAGRNEDALSVQDAQLAMLRRLGAPEVHMLVVQVNLACTYYRLGRFNEALPIYRDAYSGYLKLKGEEGSETLLAASNYAASLVELQRFEEARSLMRQTMPVAR